MSCYDIQGILFDVGDTLTRPRSGHWFIGPCFKDTLRSYGEVHLDEHKLQRGIDKGREYLDRHHFVLTEDEEFYQFKEFYKIVLNELDVRHSVDSLVGKLAKDMVYNNDKFVFFSDVTIEISNLYTKKLALGVISDTWPSLERVFVNFGLRKYFKAFVISSKIGYFKPDERLYREAINQMELLPQDILFVDNSVLNVEKANELGLNSLLIDRYNNCNSAKMRCVTCLQEISELLV